MTGTRGDTFTAEPELAKLLRALQKLPPWERAYAAGNLRRELVQAQAAVARLRTEALAEMRHDGLSSAEIAELVGLAPVTVRNLTRPDDGPPEAAEAP